MENGKWKMENGKPVRRNARCHSEKSWNLPQRKCKNEFGMTFHPASGIRHTLSGILHQAYSIRYQESGRNKIMN